MASAEECREALQQLTGRLSGTHLGQPAGQLLQCLPAFLG
jgi:hypothetical protein